MNRRFSFFNVNDALPELSRQLMNEGDEVGSRLGERTMELTHVGIRLDKPWQREIVHPDRKANVAAQIAETMWVLSGRNDIGWLSSYLPRAGDFSDDGRTWRSGYGPRLRDYAGVDQLARVVELLRTSPGTRQAVLSIWDPQVDGTPGKDTACNDLLQFLSRKGELDLHVYIRSNDLIWGWSGINAFEWSALQEIVAGLTGLMVGELHFTIGSLHVYDRHWAKAHALADRPMEQSFSSDSPRFDSPYTLTRVDQLSSLWFDLERLIREGWPIGSQVDNFPEPMLRSWLRVLQWYWSGDEAFLNPLRGTRLHHAAAVGVKPAGMPQEEPVESVQAAFASGEKLVTSKPDFLDHVNALHAEKHAAYGDSWKRRGELGILSNIARKVDRLGSGLDTADETQLDTAIDLLVYLAKYRCWLSGSLGDPQDVRAELAKVPDKTSGPDPLDNLPDDFDFLCTLKAREQKINVVDTMLVNALALARSRW